LANTSESQWRFVQAQKLAFGWILPLALAEKLCYPALQSDA
jgi:hypothetical protein